MASLDGAAQRTSVRLVCFSLAEQRFAVQIEAVKEAVELRPITPVFLVPDFVRGIMNLRGEIVAVLDLLRLLGFSALQIRDHSRVVIVRHGLGWKASKITGLLADQLCGVVEVEPDQIQAAPATLPPGVSGYLRGVISRDDQPLLVLDLERVLGAEALAPFAGGKTSGRISNKST